MGFLSDIIRDGRGALAPGSVPATAHPAARTRPATTGASLPGSDGTHVPVAEAPPEAMLAPETLTTSESEGAIAPPTGPATQPPTRGNALDTVDVKPAPAAASPEQTDRRQRKARLATPPAEAPKLAWTEQPAAPAGDRVRDVPQAAPSRESRPGAAPQAQTPPPDANSADHHEAAPSPAKPSAATSAARSDVEAGSVSTATQSLRHAAPDQRATANPTSSDSQGEDRSETLPVTPSADPTPAVVQSRPLPTADAPAPLHSGQSTAPDHQVTHDARSDQRAQQPPEPRVHIGQVEVVITAPAQNTTRQPTAADHRHTASRRYLRGL